MKTLLALTKNTLRETMRDRILLVMIFFAVALIIGTILLSSLSARQGEKVILDVGLGMIDIFGLLITLFVGAHLIFREIDKKTILLLLSKPISRSSFLLSKFFGLSALLAIMTGIMLVVFLFVLGFGTDYLMNGEYINMAFLGKILLISFFSLLSFLLLVAIVLFFSSFLSPIVATFSALSLFVIGHITDDLRMFAQDNDVSSLFSSFADIAYFGLPNFSFLNLKIFALNDITLTGVQLFAAAGGALLWMTLFLLGGTFFFSRKEF